MERKILLSGALCCVMGMAGAQQRPNVIFILADDLGWKDLTCTGSDYYQTPNLDRLAADGVMFTQAYAACPVSSPTRASIMSGRYTPRHGITDYNGAAWGEAWRRSNTKTKMLPPSFNENLPHRYVTLAEAMREGGYKTFFAGKWHLGTKGSYPEDHGFDINIGGWDTGRPVGGHFSPYENPKLPDLTPGEELSMRLARETVSFIEGHTSQKSGQPFFAYLSFYAVHSPLETTREYWNYFREAALAKGVAKKGFKREGWLPARLHQDNPVYAGLIRQMDDAVGLLLAALTEMGLDENTIIIFTSDNGGLSSGGSYSTSNMPLRGGKGQQWEGSIREPLFIRLPGNVNAGTVCDVPVISTDFYPTILDMSGLPLRPKEHLDGVSLEPLVNGEGIAPRALFWHYPHYGNQGGDPVSIIRDGDWKLIYYHEDGHNELYNLSADRGETTDVAAQNRGTEKKMRSRLDKWLAETGAKMPVQDPLYDPAVTAQYRERVYTNSLRRMNKMRADMFTPQWQPNDDWWGSMITAD